MPSRPGISVIHTPDLPVAHISPKDNFFVRANGDAVRTSGTSYHAYIVWLVCGLQRWILQIGGIPINAGSGPTRFSTPDGHYQVVV